MDLSQRRELNNGAGEALTRAFELVLTPLIFASLGWMLDRRLDSFPLISLGFFLFAFGYEAWKHLRRYSAEMDRQQARILGHQAAPKGRESE